ALLGGLLAGAVAAGTSQAEETVTAVHAFPETLIYTQSFLSFEFIDHVEVNDRADDLVGIATSATEGTTGRADLARRPILRAGELIETTPGVVATQHSGGGKANQYFLRGFNLDHGTDFSVHVAGVPVNMPSHGHGQGYADLNFLIPEMVDRVRYRKGPYFADVGDFSAAGSAEIAIVDTLPEGLLAVSGGSYDYGRLLWAEQADVGSGRLVMAAEGFQENGPWTREQQFEGWKGLARYSTGDALRGHGVTVMAYDADWLSTDQVPRRAVESGQIGRFDLVDPGPRGRTERFSVSADWHRGSSESITRANAYLLSNRFGLISNFTYFLDNPESGDQFEQADRRWAGGFDLRSTRFVSWRGHATELSVGIDGRYDDIDNGLYRTRELRRVGTVREDTIRQLRLGAWLDASVRWHDKVETRFGLRGDWFSADVDSDLVVNSGSADDQLLSPKLSLILGPWRSTEIYVNAGWGYHSNDARGAVLVVDPVSGEPATPVEPLVRAKGADVGLRTTWLPGLHTTVTVFGIELDSELVFVGDGGATEASRPSRRTGVEWTNVYRPGRRWSYDLDVTWTDAEFTDQAPEGDEIPGAVGTTVAAGVSFDELGPFFGALRWRYFGDIPLIEDGSVEWSSSSVVHGRLGYRFAEGFDLALDIFNLLDAEVSDVEYFYASRLPGEPVDGIEDVHFHPMEGRSARLAVTWRH
ncbi:MAG: TonB-dependent receptor, partial [Acidobacteriota bacterium]